MSSLIKSTVNQVGQLGKHVARQIAQQPVEILKNAVGQTSTNQSENQGLEALENGSSPTNQTNSQSNSSTPIDPQKMQQYAQLAEQRDELELAQIRKQLHRQYGLPVDLETGMEMARQEREQKKQEEEMIEEQEKEQEKLILEEQQKQESNQVLNAKAQSSAEMGIGRKIAG